MQTIQQHIPVKLIIRIWSSSVMKVCPSKQWSQVIHFCGTRGSVFCGQMSIVSHFLPQNMISTEREKKLLARIFKTFSEESSNLSRSPVLPVLSQILYFEKGNINLELIFVGNKLKLNSSFTLNYYFQNFWPNELPNNWASYEKKLVTKSTNYLKSNNKY